MNIAVGGARARGNVAGMRRRALQRLCQPNALGAPALLLGLTGGIGSGKSAVTSVFERCGCTVADADAIARDIVEPGTPALREIHVRFGSQVIEDGGLNRAELARIVFADPQALADLNAITHPRIRASAAQILASTPPGGVGVYDAAVLLEAGMASMVDGIIVVTAPTRQRLLRLVERGMTKDQALDRMDNQMSDTERLSRADIHIDNSGSLVDLRACATEVYESLLHESRSIASHCH